MRRATRPVKNLLRIPFAVFMVLTMTLWPVIAQSVEIDANTGNGVVEASEASISSAGEEQVLTEETHELEPAVEVSSQGDDEESTEVATEPEVPAEVVKDPEPPAEVVKEPEPPAEVATETEAPTEVATETEVPTEAATEATETEVPKDVVVETEEVIDTAPADQNPVARPNSMSTDSKELEIEELDQKVDDGNDGEIDGDDADQQSSDGFAIQQVGTGTVTVSLVDQFGAPVTHAEACIRLARGDGGPSLTECATNSNVIEFTNLELTNAFYYTVFIDSKPADMNWRGVPVSDVLLTESNPTFATTGTLDRFGSVSVYARDQEGNPVSGSQFQLQVPGNPGTYYSVTDGQGHLTYSYSGNHGQPRGIAPTILGGTFEITQIDAPEGCTFSSESQTATLSQSVTVGTLNFVNDCEGAEPPTGDNSLEIVKRICHTAPLGSPCERDGSIGGYAIEFEVFGPIYTTVTVTIDSEGGNHATSAGSLTLEDLPDGNYEVCESLTATSGATVVTMENLDGDRCQTTVLPGGGDDPTNRTLRFHNRVVETSVEESGEVNLTKYICEDEASAGTAEVVATAPEDCGSAVTEGYSFDILDSDGVSVLGETDDLLAGPVNVLVGTGHQLVEGETVLTTFDLTTEGASFIVVNYVEPAVGEGSLELIKRICSDSPENWEGPGANCARDGSLGGYSIDFTVEGPDGLTRTAIVTIEIGDGDHASSQGKVLVEDLPDGNYKVCESLTATSGANVAIMENLDGEGGECQETVLPGASDNRDRTLRFHNGVLEDEEPEPAAISVSPASGLPGSHATVSGANFQANEEVTLSFGGDELTTTTADEDGNISELVTIPASATTGDHDIVATGADSGQSGTTTFTVVAFGDVVLTLDPASGNAGSNTTVTGTNFLPGEQVALTFADDDLTTIAADEDGSITVPVTIPAGATAGDHDIAATGLTSGQSGTNKFEVTMPAVELSVDPASGLPGSQATVSGTNFQANEEVTLTFAGEELTTITADGDGNISVDVTIPAGATAGDHDIVATGADSGQSGTTTFTVVAFGDVVLTIDPASGNAGSNTTVTGTNFLPGEQVALTFADDDLTTTTADEDGSITVPVTIPTEATTGDHDIVATGQTSNQSGTASFDVTLPPVSITLAPDTGNPGATIVVSASGFLPGEEVNVFYDGTEGDPVLTETASATGTIAGEIEIPATEGAGTVVVTVVGDQSGQSGTADLPVLLADAVVTLDPTTGAPGDDVSVEASGYEPGETVSIYFGDTDGEPVATATASDTGTVDSSFNIPATASDGNVTVTVVGAESSQSASANLAVVLSDPVVTLNPIEGAVGEEIEVSATGYRPGEDVSIFFGGTDGDAATTTTASTTGTIEVTISIPATADVGATSVTVVGTASDQSGTASFEVLPSTAMITITVNTSDVAIANTLPEGTTWTITSVSEDVDGGTIDAATQLPADIAVNDPVPFGTYTLSIDAGPNFAPLTGHELVVNQQTQEFTVELVPVEAATVTLTVESADSDVANVVPAGTTWTITSEDEGEVVEIGNGSIDAATGLPVTADLTSLVPFGDYTITVENAEPVFQDFEQIFTVDEQEQAFTITLDPVEESDVTIEVVSADPAIADTLPADATWTVSVDGTVIASDTFAADHLGLPSVITVDDLVNFGTYTLSIDAGPNFELLTGHELVVNQQTQEFTVELVPVEAATVTLTVESADSDVANVVPAGTTWTITSEDEGEVVEIDNGSIDEATGLPVTADLTSLVPFGDYTITVENADPVFQDFEQTFTVDEQIEAFTITLDPVEESDVTIEVVSADPAIADTLPADATWTVSVDGTVIASDTFAADDLGLPAEIAVNDPVSFDTYVVTVNAGPNFHTFTDAYEVNRHKHEFTVELIPVEAGVVTINVISAAPDIADVVPEGTTWSITQGEDVLDSGTIGEDTPLSQQIVLGNLVEFGDYTIAVENAEPVFQDFEQTFTVNAQTQAFDVELQPVLESEVTLTVESADAGVANTVPEGTTWAITTEIDGETVVVDGGTIDADTGLPVTETLTSLVAFGDYTVTVENAQPVFQDFEQTFTVDEQIEAFTITLDPVEESDVTIEVVSADPAIADTLPADATWTVSVDGEELDSDTFAAEHLQLPSEIEVNDLVDFGTYTISIDAGPNFERLDNHVLEVDAQSHEFTVTLVPVPAATVTLTVESAAPDVANTVPAGTTWAITSEDEGEVVEIGNGSIDEATGLPVTAPLTNLVPFGDYTVTVENADPVFQDYTETFTVNAQEQAFTVSLQPVLESEVTLTVESADAGVANTVPEGTTWTITTEIDGETVVVDGGTIDADTGLPVTETLTSLVAFGDYTVTVENADPVFQDFEQTFAVDEQIEAFTITLDPVEESNVSIEVVSADEAVANVLPEDASWTISVAGEELDSDTFAAEHLQLPSEIGVNDLVPFGDYTVVVDAGPNFEPYTNTFTVDQQTQIFTVELEPVLAGAVTINVVSADEAVANVLPEDASWTISVAGEELDSDTFAAEHLQLPAEIAVNDLVPFGDYSVVVDAGPTFDLYTADLVVNQQTQTFTVELQPVVQEEEIHTGTVRVVEEDRITPVVGATIWVYTPDNGAATYLTVYGLQTDGGGMQVDTNTLVSTGVTDATGEAEFTALPDGVYGIAVVAEDGRTATGVLSISGADSTSVIVMEAAPDPTVPATPSPTDPATPDPMDPPDPTPTDPATPDPMDPADPTATDPATPTSEDEVEVEVSDLPVTGHGTGGTSTMMMLLATGAAALLGAGGLILRKNRM